MAFRGLMKRYFKKMIASLLCFLIMGSFVPVYANAEKGQEPEKPNMEELYARGAVLMDASTGRVLLGKNEDEVLPMASTTKIMTLIIALENGNLSDEVTVSEYAAKMPDVQLNIRPGERYILNDLLYSLMLESHNDVAVAIAEHIGGSVEGFADMMNKKAREIGCKNTCFLTPNGLDATAIRTINGESKEVSHSTTAKDLAKIMSYCIMQSPKKEEFLKITRTVSHSFSDCDKKRTFSCNNHNSFLNMMDEALSGKTGYTSKAGYCYVGSVREGDRTFVVALLACGWPNHKTYKWKDMTKLATYGMEHFFTEYVRKEDVVGKVPERIPVKNGVTESMFKESFVELDVVLTKDHAENGVLLSEEEKTEIQINCPEYVTAPVKNGDILGEIIVTAEDEFLQSYQIKTKSEVAAKDYSWYLEQLWKLWLNCGAF